MILTDLCKETGILIETSFVNYYDRETFSSNWELKNLAGYLSGQLTVDNLAAST